MFKLFDLEYNLLKVNFQFIYLKFDFKKFFLKDDSYNLKRCRKNNLKIIKVLIFLKLCIKIEIFKQGML